MVTATIRHLQFRTYIQIGTNFTSFIYLYFEMLVRRAFLQIKIHYWLILSICWSSENQTIKILVFVQILNIILTDVDWPDFKLFTINFPLHIVFSSCFLYTILYIHKLITIYYQITMLLMYILRLLKIIMVYLWFYK